MRSWRLEAKGAAATGAMSVKDDLSKGCHACMLQMMGILISWQRLKGALSPYLAYPGGMPTTSEGVVQACGKKFLVS